MKKLHYILGTSLLLTSLLLSPLAVSARQGESTDDNKASIAESTMTTTSTPTSGSSDDTKSETETETETESEIKPPSTDPTLRTKRLEELKTKLNLKLTEVAKKKIVLKCKPAQTVVETTEKVDETVTTKRTDVYKKVTTRLNDLITKLKANSIDTTALEAAQASLETKVATFNTDMSAYQQAMTDLRSLNCATDPVAFQAALTTARADRDKVRADAADIRDFVKNTLRPALQAVKEKLQATKTTDSEEGSN